MRYSIIFLTSVFLSNFCIAQELTLRYIEKYHLHVSLPNDWSVTEYNLTIKQQCTFILSANDKIANAESVRCNLIKCADTVHGFYYNYARDINVYKSFTSHPSNDSTTYLSEGCRKVNHTYYSYTSAPDRKRRRLRIIKQRKRMFNFSFAYLYNNDVFYLDFTLPKKVSKKTEPLLIKIADSIYFD